MAVIDAGWNALIGVADLACSAAEELDRLARGQSTSMSAVRELGAYLRRLAEEARLQSPSPLASMRLVVVRRALSDPTSAAPEMTTLDDVLARALAIAESLEGRSEEEREIIKMRDFCLALSKVTASESRMLVDLPASTEYGL